MKLCALKSSRRSGLHSTTIKVSKLAVKQCADYEKKLKEIEGMRESLDQQNKAQANKLAAENRSLDELRQKIENDRQALRDREQLIEKAKKDTRKQIADLDNQHDKQIAEAKKRQKFSLLATALISVLMTLVLMYVTKGQDSQVMVNEGHPLVAGD